MCRGSCADQSQHERGAEGGEHVREFAGVDWHGAALHPVARPAHKHVGAKVAGEKDRERRHGAPPVDRRSIRRVYERRTRTLSKPARSVGPGWSLVRGAVAVPSWWRLTAQPGGAPCAPTREVRARRRRLPPLARRTGGSLPSEGAGHQGAQLREQSLGRPDPFPRRRSDPDRQQSG